MESKTSTQGHAKRCLDWANYLGNILDEKEEALQGKHLTHEEQEDLLENLDRYFSAVNAWNSAKSAMRP